jgi:S-adenosylmethionine hydrolase
MRKSRPIVALLTDFGFRDHYVATMKAVMLSIEPSVTLVDVTHEVRPQDVRQASYLLWASYRYFPDRTLFACVVDPGVGTSRRIIVVRTPRWSFLAPDNGLLDLVLSEEMVEMSIAVDIDRLKRDLLIPPVVSSTFHGRDIFAPVAAHIARGRKLTSFGNPIELGAVEPQFVNERTPHVRPSILHIDRFGNIITNISARSENLPAGSGRGIGIGRKAITTWVQSYDSAPAKKPCLIIGSSGLVEIVVKMGSAADLISADLTTPLRILRK